MGNFTDKDKGWNKFIANMKANAGETVGFVGYLRSSGDYKNKEQRTASGGASKPAAPITMAQLASVHEFGSSDGTIPERSFMRTAMDENSKELKRLTKKAVQMVIDGKGSKKRGIGLICQRMLDMFVARIDSGPFKKLKRSTETRKGSSKPLVDTGQLRSSMDWEIKGSNKK